MNSTMIERVLRVKLMIFDVDGVLTDGSIYMNEQGEETRAFNVLDGQGLKMLSASGVHLAAISSRVSKAVAIRAADTGITHVFQGVDDKLDVFQELLATLGLTREQAGYMGDDIIDIPIMRRCGLSVAVPSSPSIIRETAHYVTTLNGGRGAVREACEFIMQIQGTYDRQLARYLA